MCLIVVKDIGVKLPDKEKLHNGFINNSDGVGVAVLKPNKRVVYIKKDFIDFETFHTWVTENVGIDDLCVIHFRLATSGKVDSGNRHPFPITYNKNLLRKSTLYCKMAVAHNGILSDYSIKDSKYSDTQKFVVDILANIKYKLDNTAIRKLVTSYIGNDKLAIIDGVNRKLILFGDFTKDESILYSNNGYTYNKNDYYGNKHAIGCDICDSTKKVIYVENEKANLCKRCRRGIKKQGWNKWYDIISKEFDEEDIEGDDILHADTLTQEFKGIVSKEQHYIEDKRKLDTWEKLVNKNTKTKTKTDYDTTLANMYNSLSDSEKRRVNQLIIMGKDFEKAIGHVLVENENAYKKKVYPNSQQNNTKLDKFGYLRDDDYTLYEKSKYKKYKNYLWKKDKKTGSSEGENENYCG